jgi:hypothetical protein
MGGSSPVPKVLYRMARASRARWRATAPRLEPTRSLFGVETAPDQPYLTGVALPGLVACAIVRRFFGAARRRVALLTRQSARPTGKQAIEVSS